MIFIDYQKEKIVIDSAGNATTVDDASKLQLKNAAIFLDTSTLKTKDDREYQFYITSNTDDGQLYYLDSDKRADHCKSLLHVLSVRENAIVGIYFSNRLLLFAVKNGELLKPRFTSDDIDDPAYEISFTSKRWGLPEDVLVEVYGHNIPFSKLFENIEKSPVYFNRLVVDRAKRIKEIVLSASIIVIALCTYWYLHVSVVSTKKNTSTLRKKIKEIEMQLQGESVKRLPLYLSSSSVPIDAVFRKLSFLEKCNYSSINITVDNAGNINTKISVTNADDAYRIKTLAKNANVKLTGGIIEVEITDQSKPAEDSDSRNYAGYFDF